MQAVFLDEEALENKICKRVYPEKGSKENPFYSGLEDISKEVNDIWIMEYLKSSDKDIKLGFEVEKERNIEFISCNKAEEINKEECEKHNYYIPNSFCTRVAGDLEYIYKLDKKEHRIRVHIVPAIKDNYEKIIKDLINISIRFIYCSNEKSNNNVEKERIKKEYLTEYELELLHLESYIKELSKILKTLDKDPMTDLVRKMDRRPFRQVKKIDSNVIFEHYVLKKEKVWTNVHERTFLISENRKIYNFLKILEQRLGDLEQEIRQNENNKQIDKEFVEVGSEKILGDFNEKIKILREQLQSIYSLSMFSKETLDLGKVYPLKTSNLFVNHKEYNKVYRLMQSYREVGELLERNKEYTIYCNTSEIYEIWCYFKIIQILIEENDYCIDRIAYTQDYKAQKDELKKDGSQKGKSKFTFKPIEKNIYEELVSIIKNILNDKSMNSSAIKKLEDLVLHFNNGSNDIYLGYNCTFKGKTVHKAHGNEESTEKLRPDIFMLINKENFFTCDAKYKNYKSEFMGIQAWYADLFECGAHKYIYRLKLGNESALDEEEKGDCLPVAARFREEENIKSVLKNCGTCILTPAIADDERVREVSSYRGEFIQEHYEEYLKYLDDNKVNLDISGKKEVLDPNEYKKNLKYDIMQNGSLKYKYHVASARFMPGDIGSFTHLFEIALENNGDHFS